MADQIINTIKPILVGELTKEINEHKNNFDEVEKSIDKVIDDIEGKIKPIAGPVVAGIKLIPFGDPADKLKELDAEIEKKIDAIDLSTELQKIEGLPEDIKSRVASLPDKVKTKLKESIDEIITGEEKSDTSNNTASSSTASTGEESASVAPTSTSSTGAESSNTVSTGADSASAAPESTSSAGEAHVSTSSASTDSNIEQSFSDLPTDQKDEVRKEIIKKLIEDKIFNGNEHIQEFINIINKKASPQTAEPVMPIPPVTGETGPVAVSSPVASVNPLPPPPPTGTEEAKTEDANNQAAPVMPPPPPPAETEDAKTEDAKPNGTETKGGALKKQRRKTKKNIRRQRLNKSTRFGRAF